MEPAIIEASLKELKHLAVVSFSKLDSLHACWTRQVVYHNCTAAQLHGKTLERSWENLLLVEEQPQTAAGTVDRFTQFDKHIWDACAHLNVQHEVFSPEVSCLGAFPSVVAALPAQKAVLDIVQASDLL